MGSGQSPNLRDESKWGRDRVPTYGMSKRRGRFRKHGSCRLMIRLRCEIELSSHRVIESWLAIFVQMDTWNNCLPDDYAKQLWARRAM